MLCSQRLAQVPGFSVEEYVEEEEEEEEEEEVADTRYTVHGRGAKTLQVRVGGFIT